VGRAEVEGVVDPTGVRLVAGQEETASRQPRTVEPATIDTHRSLRTTFLDQPHQKGVEQEPGQPPPQAIVFLHPTMLRQVPIDDGVSAEAACGIPTGRIAQHDEEGNGEIAIAVLEEDPIGRDQAGHQPLTGGDVMKRTARLSVIGAIEKIHRVIVSFASSRVRIRTYGTVKR